MMADWRKPTLGTGRMGNAALRAHLDLLAEAERPPARVISPPEPPPSWVTEAQFQRLITDLAELCGWRWVHNADSRWTQAGVPDLILMRERLIWWELKTTRGRVRPEQLRFGQHLLRCGQDWRVVRPGDWDYVVTTLCGER